MLLEDCVEARLHEQHWLHNPLEGMERILDDKAGEGNAAPPKLDKTLVKGLSVLAELAQAKTPLGVSAISNVLKLGKSNVHRLLKTLSETGYIEQDPDTRQYLPTLKLWELGSSVGEQNLLKRVSQALVSELSAEVGQTAYMSVLSGTDVLYLDLEKPANGASARPRPGQRVPAIFPASGRLLLAFDPSCEALVDYSLANHPGDPGIDRGKFLAELSGIRETGHAITVSGYSHGVSSVAVGVSADGRVVAAMGIGVLSSAFSRRSLQKFVPTLMNYAQRASALLG